MNIDSIGYLQLSNNLLFLYKRNKHMDFEQELSKLLQKSATGPFLFIGSGFSRRYIGLEKWDNLLQLFAKKINTKYSKYRTMANSDLPTIASLLASDYSNKIWENDEYDDFVAKNENNFKSVESPLKFAISEYLREKVNLFDEKTSPLKEELAILKKLNLDGIITTNWDTFLEKLFPEHIVYVGQEQLIFNLTHYIGEIYKIHGSVLEPESLVLTKENYDTFKTKNPYLAAKLITIFVEHPVIFLGYSMTDSNIQDILSSITQCLDLNQQKRFQDNLIFVDYIDDPDLQPSLGERKFIVDGRPLTTTSIKAYDFTPIYRAISTIKRQIPANLVRIFKEQIYEITTTTKPTKKLQGLIEISKLDDSEFQAAEALFLGVGIKSNTTNSEIGYDRYGIQEVANDILNIGNLKLDPKECLNKTLSISQGYIPKYKYLRIVGINSYEDFKESDYKELEIYTLNKVFSKSSHAKKQQKNPKNLLSPTDGKAFNRNYKTYSISKLIKELGKERAVKFIPWCTLEKGDKEKIKQLLFEYFSKCNNDGSRPSTDYRKLLCYYDYLTYGWKSSHSE